MTRARRKLPLAGSLDGFLIEAERGIERTNDFDVAHRTVGADHAFEQHSSLNLRPPGWGCVKRLHFLEQAGCFDSVARTEESAARAATETVAESRPDATADSGAVASTGSSAAAPAKRQALRSVLDDARKRDLGRRHRLGGNTAVLYGWRRVLLHFHRRRLHHRHGDFLFSNVISLARRIRHLVPTAATSTAGPWNVQPHNVFGERVGEKAFDGRWQIGACSDEDRH